MKKAIKEIIEFNKERDWNQFHSPENLAKSIAIDVYKRQVLWGFLHLLLIV